MGGTESITLIQSQMPAHSHAAATQVTATAVAMGQSASGNADGPGGNSWAAKARVGQYSASAPNVAMHASSIQVNTSASTTLGTAGNSQPIGIRTPYVGINYLIALIGVFPSRN